MSAATLTTARESAHRRGDDDDRFLTCALAGHYGEREREAAADALTTAQSFPEPDEHDPAAVADLVISTLNTWEIDEQVPV